MIYPRGPCPWSNYRILLFIHASAIFFSCYRRERVNDKNALFPPPLPRASHEKIRYKFGHKIGNARNALGPSLACKRSKNIVSTITSLGANSEFHDISSFLRVFRFDHIDHIDYVVWCCCTSWMQVPTKNWSVWRATIARGPNDRASGAPRRMVLSLIFRDNFSDKEL